MTLREIAKEFNMTVEQFATHIGYTRQALYQKTINNSVRTRAIIRELKDLSAQMLLAEREEAKRRFEARVRAIDELEMMFFGGGVE